MWSGIQSQGRQYKHVCLLNIEISFGPAASLVQKQKQKRQNTNPHSLVLIDLADFVMAG